MTHVAIIGTGYVGLVTAACLAERGFMVACYDVDAAKMARLAAKELPFYEPGLAELIERYHGRGLCFTDSLDEALVHASMVLICVGTPHAENGTPCPVFAVALQVTEALLTRRRVDSAVVVVKSTAKPGTSGKIAAHVQNQLKQRGLPPTRIEVACNPEFLREGNAIADFRAPARLIIGCDSTHAFECVRSLYLDATSAVPTFRMDFASAELAKYAANAMLATRISLMNEVACLASYVGADIKRIEEGVGADPRIGPQCLQAGIGYGGSCFPKDVKALAQLAREANLHNDLFATVDAFNQDIPLGLVAKLAVRFNGELRGKRIALWGLSFKPNTDDMREAPAVRIIERLVGSQALVSAYDPHAMRQARRCLGDSVTYGCDLYEVVQAADALLLTTEWPQFIEADFVRIARLMTTPIVFDGRNCLDASRLLRAGFEYHSIGRPPVGVF